MDKKIALHLANIPNTDEKGYEEITRETPFGVMLMYFKSGLGMTKAIGAPFRVPAPFWQRLTDTRSVTVIHNTVQDLMSVIDAPGAPDLVASEQKALELILSENRLDEIYALCHEQLNEPEKAKHLRDYMEAQASVRKKAKEAFEDLAAAGEPYRMVLDLHPYLAVYQGTVEDKQKITEVMTQAGWGTKIQDVLEFADKQLKATSSHERHQNYLQFHAKLMAGSDRLKHFGVLAEIGDGPRAAKWNSFEERQADEAGHEAAMRARLYEGVPINIPAQEFEKWKAEGGADDIQPSQPEINRADVIIDSLPLGLLAKIEQEVRRQGRTVLVGIDNVLTDLTTGEVMTVEQLFENGKNIPSVPPKAPTVQLSQPYATLLQKIDDDWGIDQKPHAPVVVSPDGIVISQDVIDKLKPKS